MASDKIRGKYIADKTLVEDHFDLTAPTGDKDPATKEYVDAKLSFTFPQGTIAQFRTWLDANIDSFNITDAQKSGLFKYDPTDTQSSDDNVMTLIKDAKRFKREFSGWVDVKWFGAIADGVKTGATWTGTDSTAAIQKALDFISDRGLALMMNEGFYLISDSLKPKKVRSKSSYRLEVFGKGKYVTTLVGVGSTLTGKNLIDASFTAGDMTGWQDSNIRFSGFGIHAGTADRGMYLNKVINAEVDNIDFRGGQLECLHIGDNSPDNFGIYVHHNYFNTGTLNGGQNTALMTIECGYSEVYNNVSDGGFYALRCNLNQMFISGNTFEGFKYAGIYAKSSGGGASKIVGNTLRPYAHFDPNAVFNGEMHGIYIESEAGGLHSNTISANQIIVPGPDQLDTVAAYAEMSNVIGSPYDTHKIIGQDSGNSAYVYGFNTATGKVQYKMITGSGFTIGEVIKQNTTGGTFKITSVVQNKSRCISLLGVNGANSVTGNKLEGAEWLVDSLSPYNIFSGNLMTGIYNGINIAREGVITGNNILLYGAGGHIAVKRVGNEPVVLSGNNIQGTIEGIDPQMLSKITTTERNALVNPSKGLTLFNTTTNKITYFDGTIWRELESSAPELVSSKSIGQAANDGSDLNNESAAGTITWGATTANVTTGYGTVLTVTGNTLIDPWTHQFLFHTNGWLDYRYRIHTYGEWVTQQVWTSGRNKLAIIPTTSSVMTPINAAPTQTDFNLLLANYNELRANYVALIAAMKSKGLMAF